MVIKDLLYKLNLIGDQILAYTDKSVISRSPRGVTCYTLTASGVAKDDYDSVVAVNESYEKHFMILSKGSDTIVLSRRLEIEYRFKNETVIKIIDDKLVVVRANIAKTYRIILNGGLNIISTGVNHVEIYRAGVYIVILTQLINGYKQIVRFNTLNNKQAIVVESHCKDYYKIGEKYILRLDNEKLRAYRISDGKIALVVKNGYIETMQDNTVIVIRDDYNKFKTSIEAAKLI